MIGLILTWPLKCVGNPEEFPMARSSCHTQSFCQQNGHAIVEAGQSDWEGR